MANALTVLVVDENPDSRVNTRKAVEGAGLELAGETGYGTSAVSLALETNPDAVLVSIENPVARPLETAEMVANSLPDTPIILYSSDGSADAIRRAMVFGARDYLVKPLRSEMLAESIGRSLEQEERRQMRRSGQVIGGHGRGTVITVAGAKGGVGKTVVSVNLAAALRAETGKRVAIIDADTQFGDVATMFDVIPRRNFGDLLGVDGMADRKGIEDYNVTHGSGVDVFASPPDDEVWFEQPLTAWAHAIDLVARLYEFVVIDTSGAFDRYVRTCIEASTLTLIVTSGDVSSVRDTTAALRRLNRWGIESDRVHLVLNRGASGSEVPTDDIANALERPVFWELEHDRSIPASVQLGEPAFLRNSTRGAGAHIGELARRIAGTGATRVAPTKSSNRSWRRFLTFAGERNDQ